jgi:isopropylmalate/homocitrate/citramalate synthase
VSTDYITRASGNVSAITDFPTHVNKAIASKNAFANESGINPDEKGRK